MLGMKFAFIVGSIIILIIEVVKFIKRNKEEKFLSFREFIRLAFKFYILMVIIVTLFPFVIGGYIGEPSMNIVPVFNTIKDIYEVPIGMESYMVGFWIKNILGNILLLLPLGIFLPMCFKRLRSFKSTVITCALVSLSIEVIQYISIYFGNFRSCDIDDIILNTLGGMIGFIIYKVIDKKVDFSVRDVLVVHLISYL